MAFATNDPRSATEDYVTRLWRIGVRASLRDVVTVGGATQHLLAETRSGRTAFVIGTDALRKHVADAGCRLLNGTDLASRAEVVVVGGTEELVYDDLRNAALAVRRGADFLATARDPTYPQPDGLWPGTGAILAAVEVASGRKADDRRQAGAAAAPDGARPARRGPHARGRRPDRHRPRRGRGGRARLGARADRAATRREDVDGLEPAPVAVGDTLAQLLVS